MAAAIRTHPRPISHRPDRTKKGFYRTARDDEENQTMVYYIVNMALRAFQKVFNFLYLLWAILVFIFFMILFLPFSVIPLLIHPSAGRFSFIFFRLWSRVFCKLTFIHYHIEGKAKIDLHRSYIFTSNHTSFLDAPGLALAIPMQFRPLGKKELLRIPVFGFIVKVAAVIVDRSDTESRKRSVEKLVRLLHHGISVLIFPEGTQNRSGEALQPFYDGAFRIANETGTAILPIVIVGANRLMPPGKLAIRPGHISVIVGDEIPAERTAGDDDNQRLRDKTFIRMKEMIVRYQEAT